MGSPAFDYAEPVIDHGGRPVENCCFRPSCLPVMAQAMASACCTSDMAGSDHRAGLGPGQNASPLPLWRIDYGAPERAVVVDHYSS